MSIRVKRSEIDQIHTDIRRLRKQVCCNDCIELTGCVDGQTPVWDDATQTWICGDSGGDVVADFERVANFAALPAAGLHTDEYYHVLNNQGTSWLPGWLAGTFYSKGFYYSDGINWVFVGDVPYQATQGDVDAGVVTDQFVSPATLPNASQWDTKNDSILFENEGVALGTSGTVDNIDFVGAGVTASRVGDVVTVTIAGGAGGYSVVSVSTTPYTVLPTSGETIYLIDASGGDITVNLPTAVGNTAKFTFKKIDSSLNQVDVTPNGAETIDGDSVQTILFQYTAFSTISDNSDWFII